MRWDVSAELDAVQVLLAGRGGIWVMVLARSLGLCLTAPGWRYPGSPGGSAWGSPA